MTKNQLKIDREGMPLVDKVRFHKYFPAEKALREDATE